MSRHQKSDDKREAASASRNRLLPCQMKECLYVPSHARRLFLKTTAIQCGFVFRSSMHLTVQAQNKGASGTSFAADEICQKDMEQVLVSAGLQAAATDAFKTRVLFRILTAPHGSGPELAGFEKGCVV